MSEMHDERTQEATQHRREEARRRGQAARSRDLTSALVVLAAAVAIRLGGPEAVRAARALVTASLEGVAAGAGALSLESTGSLCAVAMGCVLAVTAPAALACGLAATAAGLVQGGFTVLPSAASPQAARISLFEGARRLFKARNAARAPFALAKAGACVWALYGAFVQAVRAGSGELPGAWSSASASAIGLGLRLGLVLVVLGVIDYAFARWLFERDLRMSRAEIVEEAAILEGDPELRRRRRKVAARRRPDAGLAASRRAEEGAR
jgi:flagellar biosynthetic protein FlhB